MKKLLCFAMSLGCLITTTACSNNQESSKKENYKVGVVQIVDHASLNTIKDATVKEIKASKLNVEIDYQNANGDMSTITSIVNQFKANKVDEIIAIATPSALGAANVSKDIPVVFSAVSDPIGAKLVKSLEKPGGNITGTSDEVQVDQILDLANKMYPNKQKIGFLYNSGEANSVSNIAKAKVYAKAHNFEVVEAAFANTSEIQTSMQTLCDKADIVFSPNDNSVASAMNVVTNIAKQTKTPFFVGADSMVNDGGLATIGIDYTALGEETGKMAIQILEGKKAGEIPVKVFKDNLNVYINTKVAKELNYTKINDIKKAYENVIEIK